MEAITVLQTTENYNNVRYEKYRKTAFEIWLEDTQDLGDYPDGFDPDLYNL